MAKNFNDADLQEELAEMKEVIGELVHSKSLEDVKEAATKLGDRVSALASFSANKATKAKDETRDFIQERPFASVLIGFFAGALISRIVRK